LKAYSIFSGSALNWYRTSEWFFDPFCQNSLGGDPSSQTQQQTPNQRQLGIQCNSGRSRIPRKVISAKRSLLRKLRCASCFVCRDRVQFARTNGERTTSCQRIDRRGSEALAFGFTRSLEAGAYSGEYLVADTGGMVRGRRIDIWTPTSREAMRFGRRTVKLTVLSLGGKKRAL
jgi:hypothetical protein